MNTQEEPTIKLKIIPKPNEKEKAREDYDNAHKRMLENPSKDNVSAFEQANKHLYEVEDAYRIALCLLTDRARQLAAAVNTERLFRSSKRH